MRSPEEIWGLPPVEIKDDAGSGAVGMTNHRDAFAVRYDGTVAWLWWKAARSMEHVFAQATGAPRRPAALDALAGLPDLLAEDRQAGLARLWRHVTPGAWVAGQAAPVACRVARPRQNAPVRLGWDRDTWTLVPTREDLDAAVTGRYKDRIASGHRPVVSVLTRPESRARSGFVIDGHHALQAYLQTGVRPAVLAFGARHGSVDTTGHRDLDAALDGQPLTRWLARAAYARIPPGLPDPPAITVDVPDGLGVIQVQSHRIASVLRLGGQPALLEGNDLRGSIGQLAARARSGAPRPEAVQALRDWLSAPDLDVDPASGNAAPPDTARLRPLLRLLSPGAYRIRAYVPWQRILVRNLDDGDVHGWYPIDSLTVLPTGTWPPPDQAMVAGYQERIAAGARPAAVVLRGSTDRRHTAYLLDGHHKLAAYRAAQVEPLLIEVTPVRTAAPLRRAELEALLPPAGRDRFTQLLRWWYDPHPPTEDEG